MVFNFPSRQAKKECVVCGEQIPATAQKCTHCEGFQDWRRHINFSATVLALLTALVSVVSTSLPNIIELLRGHNSQMAIAFQGDDHEGVFCCSYRIAVIVLEVLLM